DPRRRPMRKVSERAPPEFVAVAIALAQQNRRRGIAIRDALNVHGQLESRGFKRVKQKFEQLHGKPNQRPSSFTIPNQGVSPKTSGNFRLVSGRADAVRYREGRACIVFDWKSDVDPNAATRATYRQQLTQYVYALGADRVA